MGYFSRWYRDDAVNFCRLEMTEQRKKQRLRTLKSGSISFAYASGIDCVIRNLSETGACLELATPAGIPETFALIIKPEGIKRNCQIAWRTARKIGVRFV